MMSIADYLSIDDPGDSDLSPEQIREIWKRVLAGTNDTAGAFDVLMLRTEAENSDPQETVENTYPEKRTVYPDNYRDYNVYSDIESSVYGSGNANVSEDPPNNEEKERMPENITEPPGTIVENEAELTELVRQLIEEQLLQSRRCRALARKAPNRRASRMLTLIANRNYSAARQLASGHLINSGSYFFPRQDREAEPVTYYKPELRNVWKNEVSLTTRCTNTSEGTENVPLLKSLLAAARGHAENAVELRRLIAQTEEREPVRVN